MVADRSSQWLRPLKSLVLEPVINLSGRRVALQQLKAIRLIRIQRMKTSTTVRYAVEAVQSCPQRDCVSRIPIATADCGTSTLQDGTYSQSRGVQIERELQEFITLRDKVYNIVRWAHRDRHCDFCGKVADLLVFGRIQTGRSWAFSVANAHQTRSRISSRASSTSPSSALQMPTNAIAQG
ncbi:hypothetical protein GQ600_4897 [Phytophthora cactorum]|nr:hypothetical protein GQ600_4897 [Phytophthora cactorum]